MSSLVANSRARFDYELLEHFEAGLVLRGYEVKAIRAGRAQLKGARVLVRGSAAYLVGATISPYQAGNTPPDFNPDRSITLLLGAKELARLRAAESAPGLTIVPLEMYSKAGRLKLSLALARGKKKYDKRAVIKKREADREDRRTLKTNRG